MKQVIQSPVSAKKRAEQNVPLNSAQMATLNVLIDLFIPASSDGRMPSARSLHLYADLSDLSAKDRQVFEQALSDIDARAIELHGSNFAQLSTKDAQSLVEKLRAEASPFIQIFMTQTAGRYLAHDTVMPLLGLEVRPPWPTGNQVIEGDWSLIDVVRKRPKFYREV
jgi:Gluconate 2-dehydrogenase subunit 3